MTYTPDPPTHTRGRSLLASAWLAGVAACGGGDVVAPPPSATLVLTTATAGADLDADGFLFSLDSGESARIGANARLVVSGLPAGDSRIALDDIADNCTLAGDNPRPISLVAADTARVEFHATCVALAGSVRVITTTTGQDPDPDGYSVTLDGGPAQAAGANDSVTFGGITTGSHVVALADVAGNCTVAGGTSRQVMVAADRRTEVRFQIGCRGSAIAVVTTTMGADPDVDGYLLAIDGGAPRVLADNDSLELALPPGSHTLALSGVAANCRLAGDNPRTLTIPTGALAFAGLEISCQSLVPGTPQLLVWGGPGPTPHIYSITGPNVVDLTPSGVAAAGRWSPDRSKIAFHTGQGQIGVMNANGSSPRIIASGESPSWSPDGARIVFSTGSGLAIVNPDGSGRTVLTTTGSDDSPVWSPDGKLIAFVRLNRVACELTPTWDVVCSRDIYIVPAEGGPASDLTTHSGGAATFSADPAWTPDGSRLAYSYAVYGSRRSDIQTIRPDRTGAKLLTVDGIPYTRTPIWSPDGATLAVTVSNGNGEYDLATIPATGGVATPVTNAPKGSVPSSWR